ncbi:MAG: biotin/lipoyl-containing protein [Thermodesulfobacteriota bacterium]
MSQNSLIEMKSPLSGVFYRSPGPEQPPFVEVGNAVKRGQTLCLLETMKVFTRIKSPVDGEVVEILCANEATVEKNQILFHLKR